MIKFNGRSRLKVYMPSKPIKFGFKVYLMTDASNSYVLNWILHEGPNESLVSLTQRIAEAYENRGFIVFMDRYYTTIDVIKDLSDRGFGVFAAIQQNRIHGNKKMKESFKRLGEGESKFYLYENQKILLTCWRDSKVVLLISNLGDDNLVQICRNKNIKVNGEITYVMKELDCPENIKTYSMYSRGVDRFDQLISYYTIDHKSVKWYLRIVLHLISVAMYNSFILYSKSKGKKAHYGTYLQFEQSVIESLVAEMRNRKRTEKIPKDYLNIF